MDASGDLGRSRHARAVTMLLIGALVMSLVMAEGVVARRRASVDILLTQPVVTLSESAITICADEKHTVEATVEEEVVYRWRNDPAGVTHTSRRPLGRAVQVQTTQPNSSASMTPSTATVRPPRRSVAFDITGQDPGTTVVLIRVPGSNTASLTINVVECAYKVTLSHEWLLAMGFRPHMFSSLHSLILPRVRKNVYTATGSMVNSAIGTPVGGCTPRFTIPKSPVIVKAEIVPGQYRPEVKLDVGYNTVPAATAVTCPHIGGGTSNTATIQNFQMTMKAWEFMDVKTQHGHILETQGYQATSDTLVVLELVRP